MTEKRRNCFSKFPSGDTSLRYDPRPECLLDFDQDVFWEFVEYNTCKSPCELELDLNISQSTIWRHLKKIGKVSLLGVRMLCTQ